MAQRPNPRASSPPAPSPQVPVPEVLVDLSLPKVREFTSRLRFAPNEGRIWLDERRMVLLDAAGFSSLREELIASLGVDTTRGLFTRIGYAAGCRDAEMAWRLKGSDASVGEILRTGAVLHALQGFVLPENLVSPTTAPSLGEDYYGEWLWKHSIEDEAHIAQHGIGTHAVCWMEVGYSSGYLSTVAGRRILVREIECRAMGHAHCRNIAKPVSQWEDASEDLRFLEPQPPSPTKVYVPQAPSAQAAGGAPTLQQRPAETEEGVAIVGASAAFHVLRHKVLRVAPTNATVLLLGESGVGKSLAARDVHRNSRRAQLPLVEVNCATIPEQLIESELFGVERGAFTGATVTRAGRFEIADGSTLFLDEIGTLSMTAQGKLLRVLQNGQFERLGSSKTLRTDVRVIAATNENLQVAVQEGRFREDLFFRLNVFPLLIQPLRDRRDDIPLLTETLLARFSRRHLRAVAGVSSRAMQALLHHSWPGNIRELENVLERGVILAQDGEQIDLHHLFSVDNAMSTPAPLGLSSLGTLEPAQLDAAAEPPATTAASPVTSIEALAEQLVGEGRTSLAGMEEALVKAALRQAQGNVSRAAGLLGVTRAQLDYRAKKLDTGT